MMLHVMLAGHGQSARVPKGLCGATVAGLYFSKVSGEGGRRPHLCPICRALALKVASAGDAVVCSMAATHSP